MITQFEKPSRRESMATAEVHMDDVIEISPRQLVSEEGGIVNLGIHNDFESREINAMRHRKKLKKEKMKRKKNHEPEYIISGQVTPDSRYVSTAGTRSKNIKEDIDYYDAKVSAKDKCSFLVELMSPFASRAGT